MGTTWAQVFSATKPRHYCTRARIPPRTKCGSIVDSPWPASRGIPAVGHSMGTTNIGRTPCHYSICLELAKVSTVVSGFVPAEMVSGTPTHPRPVPDHQSRKPSDPTAGIMCAVPSSPASHMGHASLAIHGTFGPTEQRTRDGVNGVRKRHLLSSSRGHPH
jgi:hypothetical protein